MSQDVSPAPGVLKRSEVLRQAEGYLPKKEVSPTFTAWVIAFVGLMLLGMSLMAVAEVVLKHLR